MDNLNIISLQILLPQEPVNLKGKKPNVPRVSIGMMDSRVDVFAMEKESIGCRIQMMEMMEDTACMLIK